VEAYCVKCRAKREMKEPQPVYTRKGQPGSRGVCPVCGTKMFRMGRTPAHASLPKPKSTAKPKGRQKRADGKLVIVESPAKARTMRRFLGQGFEVKASVGHVRDLLKSRLSVDVENDFAPTYRVPREKRQIVKELREAAQGAAEVYLATDPDREGEAIAWHLIEAARIEVPVHRVAFHEITKRAVAEAFSHPRGVDMRLVEAQQARRILDRLVGYRIGPLLWRKVKGGLSAGRVQSVALRLVVEREREIEAFVPQEFWSIEAELAKEETRGQEPRDSFRAKLERVGGEKVRLESQDEVQLILKELEGAPYIVERVKREEKQRRPPPPFITSTLQQDAFRRLHFSARRTMRVAQQLYEGVSLGARGSVGLITYMRTDSVRVAAAAQGAARSYIRERFGPALVPPYMPRYKTRAKRAQEAHEAIRPTSVRREPEAIKGFLTRDQYRLYDLIWKRFLASQMAPALFEVTTVDVKAGESYLFRASRSVLRFPGFLTVYEMQREEEEPLPELSEGEPLDCLRLISEQHFTKPQPRYSEATLVKALEEYGIGRPSTYAPIISTLQARWYVERVDRRLQPTELGTLVCDLLIKHFPDIMDVGFTAQMEEELDLIASGEKERVPVLREFYQPFEKALERAEEEMEKVEIADEPTGELCEECGSPMLFKFGRYGKFIACSNYPNCKNTKPYLVKIGVSCPRCGGELVERRSRKGRRFYGCAKYPECDFAVGRRPLPQPCPQCGGLLTLASRKYAQCIECGSQLPSKELKASEFETAREGLKSEG